ncbi:MAG: hypothetical protein LUD47_06810 [Clostridia bacterium]|nr:hypothetical protein [Clostridia bacterium]
MAQDNVITTGQFIDVSDREIAFVTRFAQTWEALRDIMGICRPIQRAPGTTLYTLKAEVTGNLGGSVGEGEEIPFTQIEVTETKGHKLDIEKWAKAVTIESINQRGYDVAVAMTDQALLDELQTDVMGRFYAFLDNENATRLINNTTFQMALAMAKGKVLSIWKNMHRTVTRVVGFVNVLDVYKYLGEAAISVQTEFGFSYIKNFMGFDTIFLCGDDEIPQGCVIATPVENICLYYINPSQSDYQRAGLTYRTDGMTNLIGFHSDANYRRAQTEEYAIMGMTLFAEYENGIVVTSGYDANYESPYPVKKTSTLKA